MKLSILIATITERSDSYFPKLVAELMKQIGDRQDIEIIGFLDNRRRTVGEKRQDLMKLARGEYVVYFDDDDRPSDDYIESIMEALDSNPGTDSVIFDVFYNNLSKGKGFKCIYDPEFKSRRVGDDGIWRGPPCHIHVIRTSIARSVQWLPYPLGKQWNIDTIWADAVSAKIQSYTKIDRVLYYYDFDPAISETLKRNKQIQQEELPQ